MLLVGADTASLDYTDWSHAQDTSTKRWIMVFIFVNICIYSFNVFIGHTQNPIGQHSAVRLAN
jgi:hypothetical protein